MCVCVSGVPVCLCACVAVCMTVCMCASVLVCLCARVHVCPCVCVPRPKYHLFLCTAAREDSRLMAHARAVVVFTQSGADRRKAPWIRFLVDHKMP